MKEQKHQYVYVNEQLLPLDKAVLHVSDLAIQRGYGIFDFFKIQEGHPYFLEGPQAAITSQLLKVMQPEELEQIRLNHDFRRLLLHQLELYYALHIQDFGTMKTLPVLREVLG